jgi:hypothetical protein
MKGVDGALAARAGLGEPTPITGSARRCIGKDGEAGQPCLSDRCVGMATLTLLVNDPNSGSTPAVPIATDSAQEVDDSAPDGVEKSGLRARLP